MQSLVQVRLLTPIQGVGDEEDEVEINQFLADAWLRSGAIELIDVEPADASADDESENDENDDADEAAALQAAADASADDGDDDPSDKAEEQEPAADPDKDDDKPKKGRRARK